MNEIISLRMVLNKQQTELRKVMMDSNQHENAIRLFLCQYAMLHSTKM